MGGPRLTSSAGARPWRTVPAQARVVFHEHAEDARKKAISLSHKGHHMNDGTGRGCRRGQRRQLGLRAVTLAGTAQVVGAFAQCMRNHGLTNFYVTQPRSRTGSGATGVVLHLGANEIVQGVDPCRGVQDDRLQKGGKSQPRNAALREPARQQSQEIPSTCATNDEIRYLLTGALPPPRTVCKQNVTPFPG